MSKCWKQVQDQSCNNGADSPGTGYNSRQNRYFSKLREKQQKGLVWDRSWLEKSDDFQGRS